MNVSFKSSLNLAKLSCGNLIAFKQRFNLSLIYCNTSHALCPFVQNKGSGKCMYFFIYMHVYVRHTF